MDFNITQVLKFRFKWNGFKHAIIVANFSDGGSYNIEFGPVNICIMNIRQYGSRCFWAPYPNRPQVHKETYLRRKGKTYIYVCDLSNPTCIIDVFGCLPHLCSLLLKSALPTAQQQAMWPELVQQHKNGQQRTNDPERPYMLAGNLQIVWFHFKRNFKPIR